MSTHITHDEWKALQSQFSDALKEIELSKSLLLESNKENENLRTAREDNWRKCEQLKAEMRARQPNTASNTAASGPQGKNINAVVQPPVLNYWNNQWSL